MNGEADDVAEIYLGIHFNHSVSGGWVVDVSVCACLRERGPARRRRCRWDSVTERPLPLQVHPLDASDPRSLVIVLWKCHRETAS